MALFACHRVKPISISCLILGALRTKLLKASLVEKELCLLTESVLISTTAGATALLFQVRCLHPGGNQEDLFWNFKGHQSFQLRQLCSIHGRNSPGETSALTATRLSPRYFNIDRCFALTGFFVLFDHYFLIYHFLFDDLPSGQFSDLPTRQMYYVAICSWLELLGALVLHHVLLFGNVVKKMTFLLFAIFVIKSALHYIVLVRDVRQVNSAAIHIWLSRQLFATFAQIFLQR